MASRRLALLAEIRSVDGGRLSLEETVKAVAIPPVPYAKCPRVEHFLAAFTGRASRVVAETLQLPDSFVEELLRFGAVYSCPVIPDTATSADLEDLRNEAVQRVGRHPSFRRPRRLQPHDQIDQYAYCRVHVHPKRFPAYYLHDWRRRIVLQTTHCIVVNKPSGCQVPPRVDNQIECLTAWIGELCDAAEPLKPVHRLDTGTEGIVVLAKTAEFARWFQKLMKGEEGRLEKLYKALTRRRPRLGVWRHEMEENHHLPGQPRRSLVVDGASRRSSEAVMEVRRVERVALGPEAAARWGVGDAYEAEILLETGRTHQIRAQLSHEGCPVLGDGLYDPPDAPARTPSAFLESVDDCIGLQAARLTLHHPQLAAYFPASAEGRLELDAGAAWWHMM